MKIKDLINDISIKKYVNFTKETFQLEISNLSDNSLNRQNLKNSAFVCIEGNNFDSHLIANELQKNGVDFFITEKEIKTDCPFVLVANTREIIGKLADNFYNHPTQDFKLISVIGTNGKTSTTYFMQKLLKINKIPCGVIGTNGVFIKNKKYPETLTTPDPLLLYKIFDLMRKAGCKIVVMEISAHAIYLKKVNNLVSDIAIFTNFSHDHLDFFITMENYKKTKFSYFNPHNCKQALININDDAGQELFEKIKNKINTKTFAINRKADIYAKNIEYHLSYTKFNLIFNQNNYNILTKATCKFNVYNILSSVICLSELGIEFSIQKDLKKLTNVKGRFNIIKCTNNKTIIIDYAHTPKSTEDVLLMAQKLSGKKLKVVIGAPGNRDEEKRQVIGAICYKYCEKIYVTSDNPKYENPLIICNEILKGAKEKGEIIENRSLAIKTAIKNLKSNEVLLILGKGIEEYQDINNLHIPYSDFNEVSRFAKRKN